MLRERAQGLWTVERSLRFPGRVILPVQSTVARLADGGLAVFSPIPRLLDFAPELRALGPVRAIVAPNRLHHLGVDALHQAHPEAKLLARPSLQRKRDDLPWTDALGDAPHPLLAGQFDHLAVGGLPVLDEVVFLHRPTRTLLLFDLCFNWRNLDPWSRVWMTLNQASNRFGPSLGMRLAIKDRAALRAALDRILALEFDRVIPSHGEVVESGGKKALEQAFAFLRG